MMRLAMLALAGLAWNPLISGADSAVPVAVLDIQQMPTAWRPPAGSTAHGRLSQRPWTAGETQDAERAAARGLDEMCRFLHRRGRARKLQDNAIESVLDVAYGAAGQPALSRRAGSEAARLVATCAGPCLRRREPMPPGEFEALLELCVYAREAMPGNRLTTRLVARANRAIEREGSVVHALWPASAGKTPVDRAFDATMLSVLLIRAQTVPGLHLAEEDRRFAREWWPRLAGYAYPNAAAFARRANDMRFYDAAYLATHVAYIPTGYGRHAIYIADCPAIYRFLRENFYDVLEMGELDLVAEFVDLLRQFGCTEENDLQVRDGTRYLLGLYHAAGDCWMDHREPGEPDEISDYDRLHKPWTGVAGVRRRVVEPPVEGTYGAVFRGWFPHQGE